MASNPVISRPGPLAVPYTYTLGATDQLQPASVFASFDGSGAGGSFIPALSFYAPDGTRIMRAASGTVLAAGASADVSWFPGVGVGTGNSTGDGTQFDIKVVGDSALLVVANGQFVFAVPSDLNGFALTSAAAYVTTVSSAGTPTVMIRNATTGHNMLSTAITIDANEFTSYTAATPPVINPSFKQVSTGDLIAIDVTVAGTGAQGLGVILVFL